MKFRINRLNTATGIFRLVGYFDESRLTITYESVAGNEVVRKIKPEVTHHLAT